MSKDVKLTNWTVPQDPKLARFEALRAAPEIDMRNYENVGEVEHHDSVQSVADKMIAKQEAATGRKIDQVAVESKVNLKGINDTRPERAFWSPKR